MRTHWTIAITQLACLAAGVLFALAATAASSTLATGLVIGGACLMLPSAGWLVVKFGPAVNTLTSAAVGNQDNTAQAAPPRTGIRDFDDVCNLFTTTLQAEKNRSAGVEGEMNSIREFLTTIDRRSVSRDDVSRPWWHRGSAERRIRRHGSHAGREYQAGRNVQQGNSSQYRTIGRRCRTTGSRHHANDCFDGQNGFANCKRLPVGQIGRQLLFPDP